jgi:hypothetical protein
MRRAYIIALIVLGAPFAASAQTIPTLLPSLEIAASPAAPAPGALVTLSVQSFSGNPSETAYVWTVNGKTVDQGLGRNAITVTAGPLGSETLVSVSALEGTTDRGTASVTIRPADVDIVWEGKTYVPPLSGILPLPNGESPMTFVAVPQVIGADGTHTADALIYTWWVNDGQAPAASGRGLSTFTLAPPRFSNPFSVSVEVATPDGSAHAARSVTIEPVTPQALLYEVAPLLGIRFDRAIGDTVGITDEATFEAFPLYITPGDTSATAAWTVNGTTAQSKNGNARQITLRKTGTGAGQYAIGFTYASASRMFEQAERSFTLTF